MKDGTKKFVISATTCLLLVLAINFVAAKYLKKYNKNLGYQIVYDKWQRVLEGEEKFDGLIIGDSTCAAGIDPNIIFKYTNKRFLNLCTLGNLLIVSDAWLLQIYIERIGAPKTVILSHTHDVWPREFTDHALNLYSQIPLPLAAWKKMLPPLNLSFAELALLQVYKYFPLYANASTLSDIFWNPGQLDFAEVKFDEFGFRSLHANPDHVLKQSTQPLKNINISSISLSPINREALTEIQKLSQKYNFKLFVSISPIYEGFLNDTSNVQYLKNSYDVLRKLGDGMNNWIVIESPNYPASVMYDRDHLSAEGSTAYSKWLTEEIKDHL